MKTKYTVKTRKGTKEIEGYVYYAFGIRVGISNETVDYDGNVVRSNKWRVTELTSGLLIEPNYSRTFATKKQAEQELGFSQKGTPTYWVEVKRRVEDMLEHNYNLNPAISPDTELLTVFSPVC